MDRVLSWLVVFCMAISLGLGWDRRPHVEFTAPIPLWRVRIALPDGLKVQRDVAREALRESAGKAAAREAAARVISTAVGQATAKAQVETRWRTRTLTKEIPLYVTANADDRCPVPAGFVRLHDAAARGEGGVPTAAGGSVDAPSGLDLSAVTATVIDNYGVAYQWKAEAEGWRRWYAGQRSAWDQRSPN